MAKTLPTPSSIPHTAPPARQDVPEANLPLNELMSLMQPLLDEAATECYSPRPQAIAKLLQLARTQRQ